MEKQIDYTDYRQKIIDALEVLKTVFNISYTIDTFKSFIKEPWGEIKVHFKLLITIGDSEGKHGIFSKFETIKLEDYTNDSIFYKHKYKDVITWLYLGTTYKVHNSFTEEGTMYCVKDLVAEYTKDKFLKESLNGKTN